MLGVTIDGKETPFVPGETILDLAKRLAIDIPQLCHDERLAPTGACRLCSVEIKGQSRLAAACHTPAAPGQEILTASPAVIASRTAILQLLAADYPASAVASAPDKPFHRLLRQHGVEAKGDASRKRFRDDSHPLLRVDMRQCISCFRCVRICDEVQGQFAWRIWNRGAEISILPKGRASLLESGCVSCGACAHTCPTGAIEDRTVIEAGSPETWTRTTCPYCGTGCEMLVGTRGGVMTQVMPAMDSPVNKGHLCAKGRYAFEFGRSKDRILHPMLRQDGQWKRVSWEEAIQFVAVKLEQIRRDSGPDAIGMLGSARGTNEENYIAQKFARVVLRTNNVDCCARVCHAPTAAAMSAMLGTGAATNSFADIEKANCFLLAGCNPTEAHPVVGARIKQAVIRGARLIVIDPRQTELARVADVHLRPRPGTNVALLNAMARVILEENLASREVCMERVDGLATFREFIENWTPETAESICDVSAEDIRRAARLYASSIPAMAFHGLGLTEHTQGTENVMALVNLALLTGNFGKAGSGVNPLRGQNNVQGAAHMGCEPARLPGFVSIENAGDAFESAWRAPLPRRPGLNLMEMIDSAGTGELKALWAIGYDVAFTNPALIQTHAALDRLELLIAQDLFMNEMASRFAHVFFPAASSFEKDGTFMNAERRVQRVRKVVEPPGSARTDWKIVCDVARAMGITTGFAFSSAEEIWDEIRSVWPAGRGITYARLEKSGLQWPCPSEDHPGTTILHQSAFAGKEKAALRCIAFRESGEQPSAEYPFLLTTGRSLYSFNAGTMTARSAVHELAREDQISIAPEDLAAFGAAEGEKVRIVSRWGSACPRIRGDERIRRGELFATFHSPELHLNEVVGHGRDPEVLTPEYKRVAVRLEKMPNGPSEA